MKTGSDPYRLADILDMKPYMKIAIDDAVPLDEDGNYLVNVGYLRVSTDRESDSGFGLDIQEADIVRYCEANGYPNLLLFADADDMESGAEPALHAIIGMIEAYNAGKSRLRVNTLVVDRIDRLGRSLLGTLQFIQDYIVSAKDSKNSVVNRNREDISFVSVAEPYCRIDKDNPQLKSQLMLFASLAEFDRERIKATQQRGRTARAAIGKWPGSGKPPYGYRYDRAQSALTVIPEEADVVREIFRLYLEEKKTPQRIAERLGFSGDRAITQILRRKSLTGCAVIDDKEYPGNHEAIIPLATWEEAQEELDRRSAHRNVSDNLLSGLLVCGECGAKMRYQKWGKTGSKLICYSQQTSNPSLVKDPGCDNERFWAHEVEQAVMTEIFRLSEQNQPEQRDPAASEHTAEALQQKLKEERNRLRRLYRSEIADESDAVWLEETIACKGRIRQLEELIHKEESAASTERKVRKARSILRTLESTWPHMDAKERQTVCQELIDRVVLYKNGTINVELKLKSFLDIRGEADQEP